MSSTTPVLPAVRRYFLSLIRAPKRRTLREFAEQEIVIPTGQYEGMRFDAERQPYAGLLLDAIDSGAWNRFLVTGPSQSGKTLTAFVIPLLYHLFEMQETVVCGVPDGNMVQDKWSDDILPVIQRTRYVDLLPVAGPGSRGGVIKDRVSFTNGATLRFMTGGSDDKGRAGFTARVLVVTELEGFARPGVMSKEGDKLAQLIARTDSYGDSARIYMECTVTDIDGRTWYEYQAGTESRIAMPCPHCKEFVTLTRANLHGWRDAANEKEARNNARFHCSKCAEPWTEQERVMAARQSRLVHAGQEIDKQGNITSEARGTLQLSFRWSAVDNLLRPTGQVAYEEWDAARQSNQELAERAMSQFKWAEPTKPSGEDLTALSRGMITRRLGTHDEGEVPAHAGTVVSFCDTGMNLCHWGIVAFDEHASPHVVTYGEIEVAKRIAPEKALRIALGEYAHICGVHEIPQGLRAVDSGHGEMVDAIYTACIEEGLTPTKGYGATQKLAGYYNQPEKRTKEVLIIGDNYHLAWVRRAGMRALRLLHFNSDYWKSHAHARWGTPMGEPGAAVLFNAPESQHIRWAEHQIAERQYTEFVPKKGHITRWEQIGRHNHYLDVFSGCCMLGHYAGVRLLGEVKGKVKAAGGYSERAEKPAQSSSASWKIGR